jgi:hypothetical protein
LSCIRRIDAAIAALIQAGMNAGEIDSQLDPPTVASAFFGLASSLRHAHFTRSKEPHPSAGEMLMTIFERGIRKR